MNIVMLTPDCFMIDRRILLEARTLVKAGHKVTLLAGFECAEENHYIQDGISIYRYRYDWDDERLKRIRERLPANDRLHMLMNKVYMFLAWRFFEKTPFDQFMVSRALQFEADIYHVHDLPCLKAGWYAAQYRNVPLIYDAHELYYAQEILPGRLQKLYFNLEKKYIKYPDAVVTVNSFLAKLMAERYKIKEPQVIMNCAEIPADFEPNSSAQKLRQKGNIPMDYKVVLYQGWLSRERNIETLIKGAKHFPDNVCLAIIGYGEYEVQLKEIAEAEGLNEKVFFLGPVPSDEILNYTAGADLGVIPYRPIDENHLYCSPNKFFEYVLAGVPVVTEDLPFFQLMKERYGVVHIADMSTPEGFGRTVKKIFSDVSLLEEMKLCCLEAAKDLNWDAEGKKLVEIYKMILK